MRAPSFLAAIVFGALCAQTAIAASHTVVIDGMRFEPSTLTVEKGDTIVWVNRDLFPHTVTADNRGFDSKVIASGKSWKLVARKRGSYSYKCTLHPAMSGNLTVK